MTDVREAFEAAVAEGVQEYDTEQLATKEEEPTAEELRTLIGDAAKDLNDEELVEAYKSLDTEEKPEEKPAAAGDEKTPEAEEKPVAEEVKWDQPWTVTDEEGKDYPPELLQKFLDAQLTFKAGGQDHKMHVADVVRNAQRTFLQEQRINTLLEQRNQTQTARDELEAEAKDLREARKYYNWIMSDPTGARFQKALDKLSEGDFQPEAGAEPQPEPDWTQEELQSGELVYQQHFKPVIDRMASEWSPDGNVLPDQDRVNVAHQLEQTFRTLVNQEGRFISQEPYRTQRLQEIFEVDLPQALLRGGYRPVATVVAAAADPDLAAENTRLKAELDAAKVARLKNKLASAPDSGGVGAATPGAADTVFDLGDIKSADEARKLLRDRDSTFGL